MRHYCFEGKSHSELCECNCPSCGQFRFRFNQDELNRKLYEAIKKRDQAIKESVEAAFAVAMYDIGFRSAYISALKNGDRIGKVPSLPAKQCVPLVSSSSEAVSAKSKLWNTLKNLYQRHF